MIGRKSTKPLLFHKSFSAAKWKALLRPGSMQGPRGLNLALKLSHGNKVRLASLEK